MERNLGFESDAERFRQEWLPPPRRRARGRPSMEGGARIPPGARRSSRTAYIFMSNPLSFLDGPLLMAYIGRPCRVILKKSILRVPLLGTGMRFVGFVPVDRKRARGGMKSIALAVRLIKERGYSFLIFPEGTRSRGGKARDFRRGGFFLALESGAPIVPVTIQGTFELMPKGQLYARKGTVQMTFHAPVPVEGWTRDAMEGLVTRVREEIVGAG